MTSDPAPRVALIVGASSGIGRETALGLARHGMRLVLAARGREALETAAAECRTAGAADVLVQPCDVGERDEVDRLVAAAVGRFGGLDAAVACAAVIVFGRFDDIPPDVFDRIVRTNVIGTANGARATMPPLRRSGRGELVLVGSLLGHAVVPYQAPYILSKYAVTAFVRLLRQENRGRGVRVHGVYPGPTNTPIFAVGGNYMGSDVRPPPVRDPSTVARRIVRAVRGRGGQEHNVGVENHLIVLGFRRLPRLYDAIVGPLVRTIMITSRPRVPGPGNVFEPLPPAAAGPRPGDRREAVDGTVRPLR
jgi:NAD(P)-dependent dehydrogenase (short-subunit alcohol dehydrogenase family)